MSDHTGTVELLELRRWLYDDTNLFRRNDDNEEVLVKRLEQYHSLTSPLVEYYKKRGLHNRYHLLKYCHDKMERFANLNCRVDASQSANSVFAEIQKIFKAADFAQSQTAKL